MKLDIGAMSVGDILDRGLKIFLARLPAFFVINLLVLLPLLLAYLFMPYALRASQAAAQGTEPSLGPILAFFFILVAALAAYVALLPLGTAAILYVTEKEFLGEPAPVKRAFAFAWRRFGSLFLASVLSGLVIVLGSFLIVPGIIFTVWFAFATRVVVTEGLSATESLNRSRQLTQGHFFRILLVLILLWVVYSGVTGLAGVILLAFPCFQLETETLPPTIVIVNDFNFYLAVVVEFIGEVIGQSFVAVCLTVLYFDLRIRKEGFDLELAVRQADATLGAGTDKETRRQGDKEKESQEGALP
jgi:hypothetical protein